MALAAGWMILYTGLSYAGSGNGQTRLSPHVPQIFRFARGSELCHEILTQNSFREVRFGRRKTRVDQLFGKQDWEFVENQKAAIEARLSREFESCISRRANALKLTAPRPVKVEDPELELKSLLRRLVAGASEMASRAASLSNELSDIFRHAHVEGPG
jgi:hypothetical protein